MAVNKKCPKCGSTKVQLTSEKSKHGFFWTIITGGVYFFWWFLKLIAAMMVFVCFDWWFAIIKKAQNKSYVWLSKRMIQNKSQIYYCHNCGHNFRG